MQRNSFFSDIVNGKYDKSTHFSLSFALTIVALLIFNPVNAMLAVFGLGLAKEIADAINPKKEFDWLDLATNLFGIIAAYVLWSWVIIAL